METGPTSITAPRRVNKQFDPINRKGSLDADHDNAAPRHPIFDKLRDNMLKGRSKSAGNPVSRTRKSHIDKGRSKSAGTESTTSPSLNSLEGSFLKLLSWPWEAEVNAWMGKDLAARQKIGETMRQHYVQCAASPKDKGWERMVKSWKSPFQDRPEMMLQLLVSVLANEGNKRRVGDNPELFAAALRSCKSEEAFVRMADLFEENLDKLDSKPSLNVFADLLMSIASGGQKTIESVARQTLGRYIDVKNLCLKEYPAGANGEGSDSNAMDTLLGGRWGELRLLIQREDAVLRAAGALNSGATDENLWTAGSLAGRKKSLSIAAPTMPALPPCPGSPRTQRKQRVRSCLSNISKAESKLFEYDPNERVVIQCAKLTLLQNDFEKIWKSEEELDQMWADVDVNNSGITSLQEWLQWVTPRFQILAHKKPTARAFKVSKKEAASKVSSARGLTLNSKLSSPRGSTNSKLSSPRGSTNSKLSSPRGSTNSKLSSPRGSSNSKLSSPRDSCETASASCVSLSEAVTAKDTFSPSSSNSSNLVRGDLKRFLRNLFNHTRLWYVFSELDTNNDDRVDFDEYRRGRKKFQTLMHQEFPATTPEREFKLMSSGHDVMSWASLCKWYKIQSGRARVASAAQRMQPGGAQLRSRNLDLDSFTNLLIHCHYVTRVSTR